MEEDVTTRSSNSGYPAQVFNDSAPLFDDSALNRAVSVVPIGSEKGSGSRRKLMMVVLAAVIIIGAGSTLLFVHSSQGPGASVEAIQTNTASPADVPKGLPALIATQKKAQSGDSTASGFWSQQRSGDAEGQQSSRTGDSAVSAQAEGLETRSSIPGERPAAPATPTFIPSPIDVSGSVQKEPPSTAEVPAEEHAIVSTTSNSAAAAAIKSVAVAEEPKSEKPKASRPRRKELQPAEVVAENTAPPGPSTGMTGDPRAAQPVADRPTETRPTRAVRPRPRNIDRIRDIFEGSESH